MLRKYFRSVVLGSVIAYSSLIGLFLIYTTLFALFGAQHGFMAQASEPWTILRFLGGTGFLCVGAAFAIVWDISKELELLV